MWKLVAVACAAMNCDEPEQGLGWASASLADTGARHSGANQRQDPPDPPRLLLISRLHIGQPDLARYFESSLNNAD
jgi:hypothetical protein